MTFAHYSLSLSLSLFALSLSYCTVECKISVTSGSGQTLRGGRGGSLCACVDDA